MDNRLFIAKRAARYFKSGDVVNLGVGIPSMCGNYAEPGVMFQGISHPNHRNDHIRQ